MPYPHTDPASDAAVERVIAAVLAGASVALLLITAHVVLWRGDLRWLTATGGALWALYLARASRNAWRRARDMEPGVRRHR